MLENQPSSSEMPYPHPDFNWRITLYCSLVPCLNSLYGSHTRREFHLMPLWGGGGGSLTHCAAEGCEVKNSSVKGAI